MLVVWKIFIVVGDKFVVVKTPDGVAPGIVVGELEVGVGRY